MRATWWWSVMMMMVIFAVAHGIVLDFLGGGLGVLCMPWEWGAGLGEERVRSRNW